MKPFDPACKGKQIESIKEVFRLADQRRSIVATFMRKDDIKPAAFVQNYGARHLHNLIGQKMLFVYEKPTKETPNVDPN